MLSEVLKSETAVSVSIQIMNAFVSMRRFLQTNAQLFQRLDSLEIKQIESSQKISSILTAIENKTILPKQGVFYDGQVFDAWQFVSDLVRSAKKSIILIDNYLDDTVLSLLGKRHVGVTALVLTKKISKQLDVDVRKFNDQYEPIEVREFAPSHDRFLIRGWSRIVSFWGLPERLGQEMVCFFKNGY